MYIIIPFFLYVHDTSERIKMENKKQEQRKNQKKKKFKNKLAVSLILTIYFSVYKLAFYSPLLKPQPFFQCYFFRFLFLCIVCAQQRPTDRKVKLSKKSFFSAQFFFFFFQILKMIWTKTGEATTNNRIKLCTYYQTNGID